MEHRFGHDFSHVRVHAGARSAQSASAVHANAYTVGSHIAFGDGQYHPETVAGRRLIAHELTHVLQQRGSPSGFAVDRDARLQTNLEIGPSHDEFEREADRVAEQVVTQSPTAGPTSVGAANPSSVRETDRIESISGARDAILQLGPVPDSCRSCNHDIQRGCHQRSDHHRACSGRRPA
jgi:hypothetical protein